MARTTTQPVSAAQCINAVLPTLDPAHVAFFTNFVPTDYVEGIGHTEFNLISIKLDEETGETVAVFEITVPDDDDDSCDQWVTVTAREYRVRNNRPIRLDKKPFSMEESRYEDTRRDAFRKFGRRSA